jgi:hypothetical protein
LIGLLSGGAALLVTIVLGALALCRLDLPDWSYRRITRLVLAHLAGGALTTWIVTVTSLPSGRLHVFPVYIAIAILLAYSGKYLPRYFSPMRAGGVHLQGAASASERPSAWIVLPLVMLCVGLLNGAAHLILSKPITLGDALNYWALKPKVLFFRHSLSSIAYCCSEPSYPLLVPLQSWWVYSHIGYASERWHQALGFLFYLDTVILAYSICRARISFPWALTGTALIAAHPYLSYSASSGMGDNLLAPYILASAACLQYCFRKSDGNSWMAVLLLVLGAVQAKNEGMVWSFLVAVTFGWMCSRRLQWRRAAAGIVAPAAGWLPWAWLRIRFHIPYWTEPHVDLHTLQSEWLHRLVVLAGRCLSPGYPFLWIYALVVGLSLVAARPARTRVDWVMLGLAGAQFAAYLFTILRLTDINYSFSTIFIRLFGQITPVITVACWTACFARQRAEHVKVRFSASS